MKPGFIEYNTVVADACQILAIAEIQYADPLGVQHNTVRGQQCRTLRITLGSIVLETGREFGIRPADAHAIEESSITKLKPPLTELSKRLPDLVQEMKMAAYSGKGCSSLAKILFSESADWGLYNITRLQTNLALLAYQERESDVRPRGYNSNRIVTNIFMQPQSAVECESRANIKLIEMIASRVEQTSALAVTGNGGDEKHPGLLTAAANIFVSPT